MTSSAFKPSIFILMLAIGLPGLREVLAQEQGSAGGKQLELGELQPLPEPARAAEEEYTQEAVRAPDDFSKPIWQWEHLAGDWWGLRPAMDSGGMILEFTYTGEVFSNLRGGLDRSTDSHDHSDYRGNLDMTLTLDTERMDLWPGGTFFIYGEQAHGRGISERHVGDVQLISNIDGPQFTQVSEYWYQQALLDNRLRIRLGKQDANAELCIVDFGVDFINSSFGQIPNVPLPAFPDPALGVTAFFEPTDWLSVSSGIYDGEPHGTEWGFGSTFDGKGGSFSLVEVALMPEFGKRRLSGKYRVGFWFHSGELQELFVEPRLAAGAKGALVPTAGMFSHNYGIYLGFDQMVFKEKEDPDDSQGLGAFFQFGWAPQDRNEIWRYYGAGAAYTGLLPSRDEDVFGVGFAHVRFSGRMRRIEEIGESETAIEFFYKARLTKWLGLQPDLQYILTPGGKEDNAVAVGLRFEVVF